MKITSPAKLRDTRNDLSGRQAEFSLTVTVCGGTGCRSSKSLAVFNAFNKELAKRGLSDSVRLIMSGCHGLCEKGPNVLIEPGSIYYCRVKPEWANEIVESTIQKGELIEKYMLIGLKTKESAGNQNGSQVHPYQVREILKNNGKIDPLDIGDYITHGGYESLSKALFELSPENVIEEIKKSRLRGRGGGGFPTGRKWESCRKIQADSKWVICNADEGDPGAFMDRSVLEGNPHVVIEGMIIGAYAVGAHGGRVYVRNEYPLAVHNLTVAIEQARKWGFIGENILGSGFNFDIRINRGGGAFVCGESTALMASLEGKPGEPRAKYIHTVEHGYRDEPTVLNNVETWANVPGIVLYGADKFRELGTEGSPGTKIFSLVGKINNSRLVEIPMGTTLRRLVEDIGGGVPNKKKVKAVQTGGPSGGCLPESLFDLQVDFDALTEAGSMMGSGGIIVMDEDTCMVDVAHYFIKFLVSESCGKCTPCREGLKEMDRILGKITKGEGESGDLNYLEELGEWMKAGSLCALGSSAPNPVLSTLNYFRDEYMMHIADNKCPAGVCKNLIEYHVIEKNCTGCTLCAKVCPTGAASGVTKQPHSIDTVLCIKCDECYKACKFEAIGK
ncbi:MAG: 4Fe-4S binding protein [bacterium]|nr:4Fe-4S binding protein [bacterium]